MFIGLALVLFELGFDWTIVFVPVILSQTGEGHTKTGNYCNCKNKTFQEH